MKWKYFLMTRVNRKFSPDTESLTQVLATGMPTQLLVIKTGLSAVSRLALFIDPSCRRARDCAQRFLNACHISSTQQPLAFIPQLWIQQPPLLQASIAWDRLTDFLFYKSGQTKLRDRAAVEPRLFWLWRPRLFLLYCLPPSIPCSNSQLLQTKFFFCFFWLRL